MVWFGGRGGEVIQDPRATILRLRCSQHLRELAYRWDDHATIGEEPECADASRGRSAARQMSSGVISVSVVPGESGAEVAEGWSFGNGGAHDANEGLA